MNDENDLREKARTGIQTGRLPARRPDRMWGGPGTGALCSVCDSPVERQEMGFDLEFAGEADGGGTLSHAMHVRCFAVWELERDMEQVLQVNGFAGTLPIPGAHGTITAREHDDPHRQKSG